MCSKKPESCNCIGEILTVILLLQKNSGQTTKCLETCDKRFLGEGGTNCCYNTRPVAIFNCNGEPWVMPTSKTDSPLPNGSIRSPIFRIEKIDECCATFRVLDSIGNDDDPVWGATDSFFTVDLTCICGIKCYPDTFVDLCI